MGFNGPVDAGQQFQYTGAPLIAATAESVISTQDALPVCLCPRLENPYRLVSLLWIMNRFRVHDFSLLLEKLFLYEHGSREMTSEGKGGVFLAEWAAGLQTLANQIKLFCDDVGFQECSDMAGATAIDLVNSDNAVASIWANAKHLKDWLIRDAFHCKFVVLDIELSKTFDRDDLFGTDVARAFPSARLDIKEAGNCLALELNTAAVFHLMRVAEYGLRALAFDRRIKVPKGTAIELATWEEIIKQLEKAEQDIQGYKKTRAREVQYEFYHGAMLEFKRFKNVYRNRVMHAREDFEWSDARSVFIHVKAFMRILSSRISEITRTPKVWRKV